VSAGHAEQVTAFPNIRLPRVGVNAFGDVLLAFGEHLDRVDGFVVARRFELGLDLGEWRFTTKWNEPLWRLADAPDQRLLQDYGAQQLLEPVGHRRVVYVDVHRRRVARADAGISCVGVGGAPTGRRVDVDGDRWPASSGRTLADAWNRFIPGLDVADAALRD